MNNPREKEQQIVRVQWLLANELFKENDLLFRFALRENVRIFEFEKNLTKKEMAKIMREEADRLENE